MINFHKIMGTCIFNPSRKPITVMLHNKFKTKQNSFINQHSFKIPKFYFIIFT